MTKPPIYNSEDFSAETYIGDCHLRVTANYQAILDSDEDGWSIEVKLLSVMTTDSDNIITILSEEVLDDLVSEGEQLFQDKLETEDEIEELKSHR